MDVIDRSGAPSRRSRRERSGGLWRRLIGEIELIQISAFPCWLSINIAQLVVREFIVNNQSHADTRLPY
jgi:hypothetical protein